MTRRETHRTTVTYALSIVGANERILAERLGIPVGALVNYLAGIEPVPTQVFLKAVDVVLASTAEDLKVSRALLDQIRNKTWSPAKKATSG